MLIEVQNTHGVVRACTDAERRWLTGYLTFPDSQAHFTGAPASIRGYDDLRKKFPRGFLSLIQKGALAEGIKIELIDTRVRPCEPDLTADLSWLRWYQLEAVEAVVKHGQGLIQAATGAGKGEIVCAIARAIPCQWLFLVHRAQLVADIADRWEKRFGEPAGRIGDGKWSTGRLTCATFQSLYVPMKNPLHPDHEKVKALLESVGGILGDECFPAGTRIGDKHIEDIQIGDEVPSWDGEKLCTGRVVRLFASIPRALLRLHFADGASIVCTPGHPFLTTGGEWKPAYSLCGENVLSERDAHADQNPPLRTLCDPSAAHDDGSQPDRVLRALPEGSLGRAPEGSQGPVQGVRRIDSADRQEGFGTPAQEPRLLLGSAQEGRHGAQVRECGCERCVGRVGPSIVGADVEKESDERPRRTVVDGGDVEADRAQADAAGGQWAPAASTAPKAAQCAVSNGPALGVGVLGSDQEGERDADQRTPGYRAAGSEDRSGGRWCIARDAEDTGLGQEEGRLLARRRVVRVEVLEPEGDGRYGGLCPDGRVYNFEVEGTHTYVANGFVVHNCHVVAAESYGAIARATKNAFYRIGLSGTPLARGDKRSIFVVGSLGSVIYKISAAQLIEEGVLSRPVVRMVTCPQDSTAATHQGVYGELIARSRIRNRLLAMMARAAASPGLLFVKEVKHGQQVVRMLAKLGLNAEFVWGALDVPTRQTLIKRLVRGDLDFLVCSVVFQEGIDIPSLRSVIIGAAGQSVIASLQRIGRGMRAGTDKTTFEVWDVLDVDLVPRKKPGWMAKHAKKRFAAYRAEKHDVQLISEAQLGLMAAAAGAAQRK